MWDSSVARNLRNRSGWSLKTRKRILSDRISAHRARSGSHRGPLYRTEIFRSIRDIEAARWDELSSPSVLARSHAYLEAVEASSINDYEYFFPVIFNETNEIVAHACVYTVTTDFAQLLPGFLRRLVAGIRRFCPGLLNVRITECASPLMVGHSITIRPGEDRERLILELGRAVSGIARSQKSSLVVIRDFLESERKEFDTFLQSGYNLASNMPLARIRVRWNSYEEYLSNMRSRYRKDVRRKLKRADKNDHEIMVLKTFAEHANIWAAQARVVYENTNGFKREIIPSEYYENMDYKLGDRSMLLVFKRDGRMVAHGMILADDSHTVATYFGRESGPANNEWFSLINEAIRISIDRKSAYINLGRGLYDAKSIVGADIEPLFVYSKSTIAPVNWLMKLIPRAVDHPIEKSKRIFHD